MKSKRAEIAYNGEQFQWLHICWSCSIAKVENVPIRMNGEKPTKTPAIFEKTVMVTGNIFMY